MDSQYMCHCCARCFGTADELFGHVQCQQLLLLSEVQALCRMPQPSIANVLEVLVQCVTHATKTTDWKQNLGCPEPGCSYVAAEGHQALQRHYLQHISCDFACPFCSKPMKSVSVVARHPDKCKDRRGRSIPRDAKSMKTRLVQGAHAKLRLAQNGKRFVRRNSSTRTAVYRHPRLGSPSRESHSANDLPFTVTNTNYNTAMHDVMLGGHTNSLPQSYTPSATMSLPNFGNGNIYNVAGDYFSEIDSTPVLVIGNSVSGFSPGGSPQEPIFASIPAQAQMYQTKTTPDTIDTHRALSLTHTADGVTNHAEEQHIRAVGVLPADQASLYMQRDSACASSLSYPLDGGAYYAVPCPTISGVSAAYEPEDFSMNGGIDRALGLMYPADGIPHFNHCFLSPMESQAGVPF